MAEDLQFWTLQYRLTLYSLMSMYAISRKLWIFLMAYGTKKCFLLTICIKVVFSSRSLEYFLCWTKYLFRNGKQSKQAKQLKFLLKILMKLARNGDLFVATTFHYQWIRGFAQMFTGKTVLCVLTNINRFQLCFKSDWSSHRFEAGAKQKFWAIIPRSQNICPTPGSNQQPSDLLPSAYASAPFALVTLGNIIYCE